MVEASRAFVARLTADLGEAGLQTRYPLVIWRDREGFMKACACTDSRSWAFIRDDLDAPDRLDPPTPVPGDPLAPQVYPGDGSPESLPYPTLPPIAPADGSTPAPAPGGTPGVTPGTTPGAAPTPRPAPAPARPPAERKAPEPKKSDDTTFF